MKKTVARASLDGITFRFDHRLIRWAVAPFAANTKTAINGEMKARL